MSRTSIKPQNLPEALVWYFVIGTYFIYLLGAQFLLAILLACFLNLYLLVKFWNQTDQTPTEERITLSFSTWVWFLGMLAIALALVIGHLNFDQGLVRIVKSSVKWLPFALLPLAGSLKIRSQLITRAVCILCLQSLILIPILYLASVLDIPSHVYTSPLAVLGGAADRYEVHLYVIDSNEARLILFTPHGPALGLAGNLFFCIANQELNQKWRWFGMIGAVAMIVASVSRMAVLCLPFVIIAVWFLTNFFRPWVQFTTGFVSVLAGIFLPTLIDTLETFKQEFHKLRPGSSRVREVVLQMTIQRWRNEAPVWGHGVIEPEGPPAVYGTPLGTHHTWFSLLFAHGLVGCVAFALTLGLVFIDLLIKAQNSQLAKVGLGIVLVFFVFTFGDVIYDSSYTYCPALLTLGIAFKEKPYSIESNQRKLEVYYKDTW